MPMSPRLLRPRASGVHPEAASWAQRVRDNGGSVSGSTLAAVSRFCAAIDTAGLRNRFYRLNLLAGSNLAAAQVPLYRSTAFGGTVLGNTLDVNAGIAGSLFIPSDYTEATGLQCGGDTKQVAFELSPRPISTLFPAGSNRQTGHLCTAHIGAAANSIRNTIGVQGGATGAYIIQNGTGTARTSSWGTRGVSRLATTDKEVVLQRRSASGEHKLYLNGAAASGANTGASTTNDLDARFCAGGSGDVTPADNISNTFHGRLLAYSVGDSMDDTQAQNYYNALATFLSAVGR